MTKLLLNTGTTPLYTTTGAAIPPGGIVTSDEIAEDDLDALETDGVLVHVKPSELPQDEDDALLSDASVEHLSGNAERPVRDDAGVKKSASKGGTS